MNFLVLTAKFGLGHYKVAEAIKENIERNDSSANVTIVDFMSFLMPKLSPYVYKCYDKLVFKNARLYNAIGKTSNRVNKLPLKYVVSARINKLITENNANAVIVAFPLCSQYISAYKEMTENKIPFYTCVTDIPVHNEWLADDTRLYFVACEETKKALVAKGIDPNIIRITGVPVRQEFKSADHVVTTGKTKKLLVMGGGLGLLPGSNMLLERLASLPNVEVTVIAGKNKELQEEISGKFPSFNTIGYTDEISKYMNEADAVITKPGGVTLFEAINTCTPLYVVKPFLLQEFGNAEYIVRHNIGKVLWAEENATADDITDFLQDDEKLNAMKKNMSSIAKAGNRCDIISEILYDLEDEELKCS
jgi:UDP-N-acetylglucosamine:LPS N-acetylglucosamine transferase